MSRINFFSFAFLIFSMLIFIACDNEPNIDNGTLKFQIKSVSTNNSASFKEDYSVIVTISDGAGRLIFDNHKVSLLTSPFDSITSPMLLLPGNYSIDELMIVDANENIVFATPKSGTIFESFVSIPLPYEFIISTNEVTNIFLEVIALEQGSLSELGYSSISYGVVKTQTIFTSVFVVNEFNTNVEMTESNLSLSVNEQELYSKKMNAGIQGIRIPSDSSIYTISVSVPGYISQSADYSSADLALYTNTPLEIVLLPNNPTSLIAEYTFENGSVKDLVTNEIGTGIGVTTASDRNGYPDQALFFDGIDDRVDFNKTFDLETKTINFWFNVDITSTAQKQGLFSINNAGLINGLTAIYTEFIGDDLFLFYNQGGHVDVIVSSQIEQNQWYMVTVTTDDIGSSYFLNGDLVSNVPKFKITSKDGDFTARIGAGRNKTINFKGLMDDVMIFSQKLSSNQVRRLYNETNL